MSTRTRIVIHLNGNVFFGAAAVKQLFFVASRRGLARLPPEWKQMAKRDRLIRLAEYLIPEDALQIFQEPKGTRKNKSLYWQALWNRRPKAAVKPRAIPMPAVPPNQYAFMQAQQDAMQNAWNRAMQPRRRIVNDEGI